MSATAVFRPQRMSGMRLANALTRIVDDGARQRLFSRWPGLASPGVARQLLDASHARLRADARAALLLARAAGTIGARLDDRRIQGQSCRAAANALSVSGSIREALALHQQAAAAFEQMGDEQELARTLNSSIQPLILLGEYDRAMGTATRARELFVKHADERRLARLEINVGNLLHRQDRFEEALACYERAHARLVPLLDHDGIVFALHNKAVALTALNDFYRALGAYRAAREICVERRMPLSAAQADYNIAWLYYLRGEYGRALELLHAAAAFARSTGDGYHQALCLLDLAEIYLQLNLRDEARELADDARARFRDLGLGYEAAKALVTSAIAAGQDGAVPRAIELFAEARAELVRENNHVWPSLIDLYQALLLVEQGQLDDAHRLCAAALDFFSSTTLHAKTALCRLLLARIHLQRGRPAEAQVECERALNTPTRADNPTLTYHALLMLGHVGSSAGNPRRAYASYRAAREALEELRSHVRGEELKIAFVRNKLEVYERLVEICLETSSDGSGLEEVFSHIEHAKSRTLLELMSQPVQALARADVAGSALGRSLRELRRELSWYYHRFELEQLRAGGRSSPQVEHLQQQLSLREREFARILRELAVADSRESELQRPAVYSIDEVRAALPGDAVLLEYFEVRDRLLVCLVDRQECAVVPLCLTADVGRHLRMVQFHLSKFRLTPEYVETFGDSMLRGVRHHLRALFTALLAPVWRQVRGRHLLIVPHGCLHYVPFHALYDGGEYVVDASTVSYAPSASIYAARCHMQPGGSPDGALVLGVPDAQAPYIEAEAQAVAAALPGARLFLGGDATEDVLRTHGRNSRVIHIATHAYFRPGNPMLSALKLGDGDLNVHDLYSLDLPAQLVTLSGCATGANITTAGDELLGITRGLFCAGAQALIVSLWDVHDQSTTDFMRALYAHMAGGAPVVRALRETMMDVRREHPHPCRWAPFVLMGKFWHE